MIESYPDKERVRRPRSTVIVKGRHLPFARSEHRQNLGAKKARRLLVTGLFPLAGPRQPKRGTLQLEFKRIAERPTHAVLDTVVGNGAVRLNRDRNQLVLRKGVVHVKLDPPVNILIR